LKLATGLGNALEIGLKRIEIEAYLILIIESFMIGPFLLGVVVG
jgi:hypothetical protein